MIRFKVSDTKSAIVDNEDYPVVKWFTWHLMKSGYVARCFRDPDSEGEVRTLYLSHLIVGYGYGHGNKVHVKYRDGNRLNYQKENLIVTVLEAPMTNKISPMRLERVESILSAEPTFREEMAKPKIEVVNRHKRGGKFAVLTIKTCRALAERQLDPHNCERADVVAIAHQIVTGEIKMSEAMPHDWKLVGTERTNAEPPPEPKQPRYRPKPVNPNQPTLQFLEQRRAMLEVEVAELKLKYDKASGELLVVTTALRVVNAEHGIEAVNDLLSKLEHREPAPPPPPPVLDAQPPPLPAPALPPVVKLGTGQNAALKPEVVRERIRLVLTNALGSRGFINSDFYKVWVSRQSANYIRELAKALPVNEPFLMADGITVNPRATDATVAELVQAIFTVSWPTGLWECDVDAVKKIAQENLKRILTLQRREQRYNVTES